VISLLLIELQRLSARRLFRLLAVLAVIGILLAGSITLVRSHRPSPERIRQAQQAVINGQRDCKNGQNGQNGFQPPPGQSPSQFCSQIGFNVAFRLTKLTDIFKGTTVPLVLLATATCFVGLLSFAPLGAPFRAFHPNISTLNASECVAG